MTREQFSSEEQWSEISGFPNYMISTQGRVQNRSTGRFVTPALNSRGVVIVGLMLDGKQQKRSLPLLVASHFVPQPPRESFDTPIHLNGERTDNRAANLMWRPLWFARKYMKQFHDEHMTIVEPIEDAETHELYKGSMEAATTHGLLDHEIYISMLNNTYVWPTGQVFCLA